MNREIYRVAKRRSEAVDRTEDIGNIKETRAMTPPIDRLVVPTEEGVVKYPNLAVPVSSDRESARLVTNKDDSLTKPDPCFTSVVFLGMRLLAIRLSTDVPPEPHHLSPRHFLQFELPQIKWIQPRENIQWGPS